MEPVTVQSRAELSFWAGPRKALGNRCLGIVSPHVESWRGAAAGVPCGEGTIGDKDPSRKTQFHATILSLARNKIFSLFRGEILEQKDLVLFRNLDSASRCVLRTQSGIKV
jgi:hypothetical protein